MSTSYIIISFGPYLCQKLSKLVEIWQSYDINNFDCFFSETLWSHDSISHVNHWIGANKHWQYNQQPSSLKLPTSAMGRWLYMQDASVVWFGGQLKETLFGGVVHLKKQLKKLATSAHIQMPRTSLDNCRSDLKSHFINSFTLWGIKNTPKFIHHLLKVDYQIFRIFG